MTRNPVGFLISKGWQCAGKLRKVMVVYVLMFMVAQIISLIEPWVIGNMLNVVQTDISASATAKLVSDIEKYLAIFFAIQFSFWSLHGPARVIERCTAFEISNRYKSELFRCLTQLPMSWQRQNHSGESIDKINRAAFSVLSFFQNGYDLIYMVFRLFGTLAILFCFMPVVGWSCLLTTTLAFTTVALIDTVLNKQYAAMNKQDNYLASGIHDYVSNIVSVITLRLEHRTLEEVNKRLDARRKLFRSSTAINEAKWFGTTMFIALMIVLVLYWYAQTTIAAGQPLMAGTFFTLFEYLRRIGDSFYRFTSYYGTVVRQSVDVQGAESILQAYREMAPKSTDARLPSDWKAISVRELAFAYEDEENKAHQLENVSLDLQKGRSYALVGHSGSGKSTLLSLLRGLQPPEQAQVYGDGNQLASGLSHLAYTTSLLPQDPEIFSDTIRFNITFGMEACEADVMEAIRLARFEDVLERLPKGLETNIAEKGVNLSGGEKQRLALARGIYHSRDSEIVLLDEPTSSVDTQNEREIYTSLLERYRQRCVISSIHKLHLLELFDYIYVFERGRIVEHGDFATLTAGEGVLASAWQAYQAQDQPAPDVQ